MLVHSIGPVVGQLPAQTAESRGPASWLDSQPSLCPNLAEQGLVTFTWSWTTEPGAGRQVSSTAAWKYKYSTRRTDIIEIDIDGCRDMARPDGTGRRCGPLEATLFYSANTAELPNIAEAYCSLLHQMGSSPTLKNCFPMRLLLADAVAVRCRSGDRMDSCDVACVVTGRTGGQSLSSTIEGFNRRGRTGTAVLFMALGMCFALHVQSTAWEASAHEHSYLAPLRLEDITVGIYPVQQSRGRSVRIRFGVIGTERWFRADPDILKDAVHSFLQVPVTLGFGIEGMKRTMEDFIVTAFQNGETGDLRSACVALGVQLQSWMSTESTLPLSPVQAHHWQMLCQIAQQVTDNRRSCVLNDVEWLQE